MYCEELHRLFNSIERIKYPFSINAIMNNGIYIMFEEGEKYKDFDRIVRVGTHRGQNNLKSRLKEHYFNENKDRSIFRKNIGRAILNKRNDLYLKKWELDFTTREMRQKYGAVRNTAYEQQIESEVTDYIRRNISFIVFEVNDVKQRLRLEEGIIASIAQSNDYMSSSTWLGRYSTEEAIRDGGMWNKQHINGRQLTDKEYSYICSICIL